MASSNIFGSLTNTVKKVTEEAKKKVKEEQEKSTGLQKTDSTGKSSISSTVTKTGNGTNTGSSTSNNTQKKTVTNADKLLSGVTKGVSNAANTVSKATTASGTKAAISNTAKTAGKVSNASKLVNIKSGVANTTGKKTVKELVNQTMSNPELAKRETGFVVKNGINKGITKAVYPNGKGSDNTPESGYKLIKSQVNPSVYNDHEGMGDDFFIRKKYEVNDTQNVKEMGARQLSDWRNRVSAGMQSAIQKTNAYNQLTDEEKQALKDETVETDIQAGRYTHLSVDGLPYMEVNGNMYAIGQDEEQAATGFLKSRPSDYYVGNNREDYDRIAYDYMNGIGSYDEYIWNMETDEDAEKLDAYMDDFWNRLETGGFTQAASETRDLMYQKDREASGDYNISGYEREMEKINDEAERQGTIEFYQRYAPNTGYVYNPNDLKDLGITYTSDMDKPVFQNKADEVFYYINEMTGDGLSDKMKYDLLQPEWFMTDEQKQKYNEWYSSGDKQAAQAYYDALYPYLRQIMLDSKKDYEIELTRQGDLDMYIRRAVTPEVAGIASTIGAIGGGLFGVKEWQDPDAPIYDMSRTNQNIQTGSAVALGDTFANWFGEDARGIGEQIANMGWSVTDNIRRQLITKGVSTMFNVPMDSTFAKNIDFMLLGSDVMGNTMATELANGRSPTEALVRAAGSAMIEILTENMWWDDLYSPKGMSSTKQEAFKYLKSSFLSEGSEEVSGHVLDTIFDEAISALFGHKSELEARTDELTQQYITEENMDPEEAKKRAQKQAGLEWLEEGGISFLTGGMSALITGGGRVAADVYQTRKSDAKLGSDVLAHGIDTETADNKGKMAAEAKNEFTIMELGEGFKEGTLTKQLADKMREDVRKGKGINKADVGELVRSIVNESSEKVASVSKNILGNVFQSELNEKGVENAEDISNALVNIIVDGDDSNETLSMVAGNQAALDIIREYKMGKFSPQVASIEEQTATERAASKSVMEMLPQANDANVTADAVKQIVAGATVAAKEEIKNAEGQRTGNKGETVSEGKIADIAGIALKKVDVEVEGEDGKTTTQQQTRWQVTMSDGREVDIADVKAVDQDVAETLAFLQNDSGKVIGQNLADTVLKIATTKKTGKTGGDMATTLSNAVRVMWAAATEQATPKISGMSAADTAAITDAVKADLEDSEKKRTAAFTVLAAGKGTTTLNGVAYGTNAFNEMVNKVVRDNNLGDNVKTEAQVIGSIAKSVGAQVELYYDANDTANQGMFTAGGGIRINLAGTTNKEGAHRSALATFAHEVTHNIEANSPEAYKALRSFVFSSLGGKLNIQSELSRIQAAYAHYGEHLDIAGAVSELVAKASETVLTDESVIRQLQEQDADLAGTVGDAVNELVNRVQSIKGDALTSASMYARAMGDVSRGLSQAWMGAYREAAAATGTTAAAGKSEYAFAGTDPDTGRSIYINNFSETTQNNAKRYYLVKLIRKVFSKSPIELTVRENGTERTIQAQFDPDFDFSFKRETDAMKIAFKNKMGSPAEKTVMLNLADDYKQILEESNHKNSEENKEGKLIPNADMWHYFVDDIYYVDHEESDVMTPYKITINIRETEGKDFVYSYSAKKTGEEKKLSVPIIRRGSDGSKSGGLAQPSAKGTQSTNALRSGKMVEGNPSADNIINDEENTVKLDEKYRAAVESGDIETATEMLMDKMRRTSGVIPIIAPEWHTGESENIAKLLKTNNPGAIETAAQKMKDYVPDNAVLIPMPGSSGKATEGSWVMNLTNRIAELTGRPVVVALEGNEHESRQVAKARGERGSTQEELGFRKIAEIPDGTIPVFIDNTVGSGVTADAAREAMGGGITLAFTKTLLSRGIPGLKNVVVTYESKKNGGGLIPLSQRMNVAKRDTRYSISDEAYQDAVRAGDMDEAQQIVDEAAEQALKDSKIRGEDGKLIRVYHNTDAEFNEFDTAKYGGKTGKAEGYGIYLTDDQETASNYGGRQIAAYANITRPAYGNKQTISRSELIKLIRASAEYQADSLAAEEDLYGEEATDRESLLRDTWLSNYTNTYNKSFDRACAEVADSVLKYNSNDQDIIQEIMNGMGINEYFLATDFYKNVLTPTTGIDGIWTVWENQDKGLKANIFLAFESSQVKLADPVVYEDNGEIIPPRERFNTSKGDIRYSIQDEMDYDVQSWMETVPEWSLKTEAEKTLLQDFKSLRMKMQLDRERENQTQADIKKLEELLAGPTEGSVTRPETMENALEAAGVEIRPADPKKVLSNPTLIKNGKVIGFIYGNDRVRVSNKADPAIFEEMGFAVDRKTKMATYVNPEGNQMGNTATKKKLEALKVKLQNIRNTQEKTREKLAQITGNEGFGGMMYRQQQVLNDLLYNKTQGEVQDSVERMQKRADAVARTIEKNQKTIAEMEKGGIVQKLKEILGTTTAEQAVRELKQMTNSTWTRNEITPLFNEIVLKMTQGQDYQQEIENLAGILVNSSKDNAALDEDLSALRGMTLVISEGQLKELRGQGSSLKEIRQRLAGTGITVKTGEYSSLTDNLDDTIAEYGPALFQDLGDEKDALENFVTRVEQRRNDAIVSNQYAERLADTMAQIAAKAAGVAQGIYMPSDRTAQKQVLAMMEYVKGLAAQTQQAQKTLQGIADDMAAIQKEGRQASGMAGALARDVNVALDYYSRINQVAQQSARNQRQQAIIEQLKSKQAEKILKNNEEWRQLIARDAQARKQTEENAKTRGKINTVVKRMYNLLKNPKGTTNIPESMQGIARTVLESIVGNDLGGLKLTRVASKDLVEISRVLRAWTERDGAPTMPTAGETSDDASLEIIEQDVQKIRDGISQYNADIRGANKVETLQQRGEILKGIQEALSEIYTRIRTENEVFVRGRQVQVANAAAEVLDGTEGKNFRELTGFVGRKLAAMHKMIVSGNMTPEYFFRTLSNNGLTALWDNYHDAENRNGLELAKSKARMEEIADRYGYSNWDMKTRQTVKLASGDVQMTLGQIMSLWATWQREAQLGPEMSNHLEAGGFYTEEQDLRKGILGRAEVQKRAHRVTAEDMANVERMLTQEQKNFVNAVVRYMSNDMSELGNEASMAAYGIKMYKEKYYFPMQMWDGIKSRKSNDAAQGANVDRAFHPSFSKSRTHGANNALVIGDFMQVATDHIAGMINYATMGLANESLQKVLNYTMTEGENAEEATKRNVRARLEEAYGQEAIKYLLDLQMQLNGGAVRIEKTIYDKLISTFRKNAVAGSLSVALQQPMSYVRAAMLINPKYLAAALSPTNWKGSYKEMMQYSGVAVIKDMGRFDMNAGQSAREYLTPEGKESTGRKAWNKFQEGVTILPELMDRMTWTRMWSAVKAEQKAQHPGMSATSEEFLQMCGERFNDVMRRTQVYDSVLVKSANMRNQNPVMKSITSFMAEPTLTLNVLADAVRAAKTGETGGKGLLVKAGATFMLSAVLQAAIKGLMGSGRNPDDKKTWEENFLYRFFSALISEADPFQLIPGFSDLITILKEGKLEDDAMSTVGKIATAINKTGEVIGGQNSKGWYRDIEDSAGQLIQLFSNVPLKNLMRDGRAMYNWVTQPYAERETSGNVIANQTADLFWNADNMFGVVNKWLGDAGYKTDTSAYKKRVYEAMRDGDETAAQNYIDYLLNGKGVKAEKNIMTGTKSVTSYTLEDYQAGNITRTKADELLKTANPKLKDTERAKKLDEIDYEKETGEDIENFSLYTPLYDAMDQGNMTAVEAQKKHLTEVGVKGSEITSKMKSHIKERYGDGEITRKQAEELYKKYAPDTKTQDIAKALDEIDYESETGEDVESYSLYTRIYAAVDKSDASTIKSQKSYLKTLGIEEKSVNSQIASYISSQYKEGKMKKSDAESKLKNYAGKDTNDIFWTLDRIDYTKQTGKKVDSTEKYYRLYDAMDANNSSSIQNAVKTITSHGTYESDVEKTINGHYKQLYLNGSESQKVAIQDAMQKAYKALGYTEKTANKTISNWKKGK